MRYLKKLINLMAIVGFVVVFGTAGHSDYMIAVGEYYPFNELFKTLLIGVALMLPSITIMTFGGNRGK